MGERHDRSPTLIGRSAQLEELLELVEAGLCPCDDLPTVILVSGEAGVGKTRLCREVMSHFRDVRSITLAADPNEQATTLAATRRALPGLTAEATPHDAAEQLCAELAHDGAILLVEDVHWLDAGSAMVVDIVSRQSAGQLVVLLTFRPEDLSRRDPGGDLLLRLERRQSIARVLVERLGRIEVSQLMRALIGEPVPAATVAAIHERTAGNPFAVEEIIRARSGGLDSLAAGALPWTLSEIVAGRLDGLSPDEREVVEAAAIAGTTSSFDLLAAVVEREEGELVRILRSLVDRQLLEEPEPDRFVFRHALVRDAVSHQLLGRQRRRLHERVLGVLGDSPDLALRARHAHGAGRIDEFVGLARQAAAAALADGATFEALRLASEALHEEPDDPELLTIVARSAWLVGALDEAIHATARLRHAADATGDLGILAVVLRWEIRLAFEQGDSAAMEVGLTALASVVERLPSGEARAAALVAIAQTHMLNHRVAEAVAWADRAADEATALGLEQLAVQAMVERASARSNENPVDGPADLIAAIEAAERIGDWTSVARGVNNLLGAVPTHSPAGRAWLERFRTAARLAGYDWMGTAVLTLRDTEIAEGDADMAAVRRALARADEWWRGNDAAGAWIPASRAFLALEEGKLRTSADLLATLSPQTCEGKVWIELLAFQVAAQAGDPEPEKKLANVTAPLIEFDKLTQRDVFALVDAALEAGVSAELVAGHVFGVIFADAPTARARIEPMVRGLCAVAERPEEAVMRLSPLVAEPDGSLPRWAVAGMRTWLARALAAVGQRQQAVAQLDVAIDDELARWPGIRRDRAEALRRRLSGRAAIGDGELTAREREVAALLAEGLTNGQLAKRLYISPKTASVHVSNILMKLQMSTRAEVAAWAVRTGLSTDGLPSAS